MKVRKECLGCGKEFWVYPSLKRIKFCSLKCYQKSRIGKKWLNWRRVKRNCQTCGKVIWVCPCEIKIGGGKFCSHKCFTESRKGKQLKRNGVWKNCPTCGKKFYLSSCRKDRKFCSKECFGKSGKGEKNHNWANGISLVVYPSEYTRNLRARIKKRDGYVCQRCGGKKDLQVHHINYNKRDCREENLITLCRSCNNKVNRARGWWQGYFIGRMHERFLRFLGDGQPSFFTQ